MDPEYRGKPPRRGAKMGSFDKPPGIPSAKEIQEEIEEIPALSLHRDPRVDFGQNVTKLTIDWGVVQARAILRKTYNKRSVMKFTT